MANPARARRLSKCIQEIVASAIKREIRGRRLELVTIVDYRVTGDLHNAAVFYIMHGCTLDGEPDYKSAAATLEKAEGQLRSLVGRSISVRYTPALVFEVDIMSGISAHPEEPLDGTHACNAKLAKQARNAKPAGDVNPYRNKE